MTGLFAILAGLCLAGFIIFPFGTTTTSGTRFATREPFTWSKWREEAQLSLWALNPVTVWQDLTIGYEDVAGALLRLMGFVAVAAALITATVLIGWGVLLWVL